MSAVEPFTTADIARALLDGTTSGKWNDLRVGRQGDGSARSHEVQVCNGDGVAVVILTHDGSPEAAANTRLMTHAPQLAREVIRLREELARMQRVCDEALPREVILCPACELPHVENARFDNPLVDGRRRPHHTHRCYHCKHEWDSGRWSFGVEPGQERNQ